MLRDNLSLADKRWQLPQCTHVRVRASIQSQPRFFLGFFDAAAQITEGQAGRQRLPGFPQASAHLSKRGSAQSRPFNPPGNTACLPARLLLINEGAEERETEPNTVSKDERYVGTQRWLGIQNMLQP